MSVEVYLHSFEKYVHLCLYYYILPLPDNSGALTRTLIITLILTLILTITLILNLTLGYHPPEIVAREYVVAEST